MPVIAVDFNDVLAEAKEATRLALQHVTGLDIAQGKFCGKSDLFNRTIFPHPEKPSLNRAITSWEWVAAKELIYGPMFYDLTKPLEHAVDAMRRFAQIGFEVHVVSTCGGLTLPMAIHWLGLHRIPYVTVQTGVRDKGPVYRKLMARVVIDNDLKHLVRAPDQAMSILLSVEPVFMPPANVRVVSGWVHAYKQVLSVL